LEQAGRAVQAERLQGQLEDVQARPEGIHPPDETQDWISARLAGQDVTTEERMSSAQVVGNVKDRDEVIDPADGQS
jgi:hypothetical protein